MGKVAAVLALLAALLPATVHSEVLQHTKTLTRAQLEQIPNKLELLVPDATPTSRHALAIRLRYVAIPLGAADANAWTYTVRYQVLSKGVPSTTRSLTLFRGNDRDVFEAVDQLDEVATGD